MAGKAICFRPSNKGVCGGEIIGGVCDKCSYAPTKEEVVPQQLKERPSLVGAVGFGVSDTQRSPQPPRQCRPAGFGQ